MFSCSSVKNNNKAVLLCCILLELGIDRMFLFPLCTSNNKKKGKKCNECPVECVNSLSNWNVGWEKVQGKERKESSLPGYRVAAELLVEATSAC